MAIIRSNQKPYHGCTLEEVTVEGKPALCFLKGAGHIVNKEDALQFIEMLTRFYEIDKEELDHFISEHNTYISFMSSIHFEGCRSINDKLTIPKPNVKARPFRKTKGDWSFTCKWCGDKVSSQNAEHYYPIYIDLSRGFDHLIENYEPAENIFQAMCCSEICAEHLWYDIFINWICDHELTHIFHTEKNL